MVPYDHVHHLPGGDPPGHHAEDLQELPALRAKRDALVRNIKIQELKDSITAWETKAGTLHGSEWREAWFTISVLKTELVRLQAKARGRCTWQDFGKGAVHATASLSLLGLEKAINKATNIASDIATRLDDGEGNKPRRQNDGEVVLRRDPHSAPGRSRQTSAEASSRRPRPPTSQVRSSHGEARRHDPSRARIQTQAQPPRTDTTTRDDRAKPSRLKREDTRSSVSSGGLIHGPGTCPKTTVATTGGSGLSLNHSSRSTSAVASSSFSHQSTTQYHGSRFQQASIVIALREAERERHGQHMSVLHSQAGHSTLQGSCFDDGMTHYRYRRQFERQDGRSSSGDRAAFFVETRPRRPFQPPRSDGRSAGAVRSAFDDGSVVSSERGSLVSTVEGWNEYGGGDFHPSVNAARTRPPRPPRQRRPSTRQYWNPSGEFDRLREWCYSGLAGGPPTPRYYNTEEEATAAAKEEEDNMTQQVSVKEEEVNMTQTSFSDSGHVVTWDPRISATEEELNCRLIMTYGYQDSYSDNQVETVFDGMDREDQWSLPAWYYGEDEFEEGEIGGSDVDLELEHGEEGNDIWPWYGDEEESGGYDDGDSDSDDDTQRHSFVPVCSHIRMG